MTFEIGIKCLLKDKFTLPFSNTYNGRNILGLLPEMRAKYVKYAGPRDALTMSNIFGHLGKKKDYWRAQLTYKRIRPKIQRNAKRRYNTMSTTFYPHSKRLINSLKACIIRKSKKISETQSVFQQFFTQKRNLCASCRGLGSSRPW